MKSRATCNHNFNFITGVFYMHTTYQKPLHEQLLHVTKNKYICSRNIQAEMYAGHVMCCSW